LRHIESDALLVRTVAYGESDIIVTLVTETDGKLSALVRGGRKSTKRVGGALEPVHTIAVKLDDRGQDLAVLREARLHRVRARIVSNLEALEAAGTALRWARHLLPPRHAEPRAWETITGLLDALEESEQPPRVALAGAALRLLADAGYALDLERCVKCGKECSEGRAAMVDAARGGLVCRACGGAPRAMGAQLRRVARAAQRGERVEMSLAQADALVEMAEEAMAAHTGFDRG
jgi:DNA repair protein RecO (recombination protein O)